MKMARLVAGFVFASSVGVVSAEASPGYPADLAADLGLATAPSCPLCHQGDPGRQTATQPFAQSLIDAGLGPNNPAELEAALQTLAENDVDSDHDGTPDIVELKNGTDPNGGGSLESALYGCGARIAVGAPSPGATAAAAALLALFVARRRRR